MVPAERGLEPRYDQRSVDREAARSGWVTLASGASDTQAIRLAQDLRMFLTLMEPDQSRSRELDTDRYAWVHVARGTTSLNGTALGEGDGAALSEEGRLTLEGGDAEVLVFDLA